MPASESRLASCLSKVPLKLLRSLTLASKSGTRPSMGRMISSNSAPKLKGRWSRAAGVLVGAYVGNAVAWKLLESALVLKVTGEEGGWGCWDWER